MARITRALISVSDKTGVVDFARGLARYGVHILSTGGTARMLRESGIDVTDVSDYTGFPEMLDGRVKTLHPKVHGGLLGLRDCPEHIEQMKQHDILPIDMVVVNLYPFEQTVANPDVTFEDAVENIDIGGPTMIRSAAKNHKHVAVVTSPRWYAKILDVMNANEGEIPQDVLFELAIDAFSLTARYDAAIAGYLNKVAGVEYPETLALAFKKKQDLRYGENPHQGAAFYVERDLTEPSISTARQLCGKELSYNNIMDIDAALELVKEFEAPAAVVVKHANPCGTAIGRDAADAFRKAHACDPVSAFGSIVAFNRIVDDAVARAVVDVNCFIECVIAPSFEGKAAEILQANPRGGKNVRLLEAGELGADKIDAKEKLYKRVTGGLLVQSRDLTIVDEVQPVTEKKPSPQQIEDLIFAMTVCKHVKSNAIVFAKNGATVGVGAGQMSRVDATRLAASKAGDRSEGAVMASDAFFPAVDNVEEAAKAGITAIIQPGGSIADKKVIARANELGLIMVFSGQRHFLH